MEHTNPFLIKEYNLPPEASAAVKVNEQEEYHLR